MEHVVPTSYASTSLGEIDNTPLQGLQELYLSGPTSDITALLTHVTFPRSTSLSLRCTCNDKPDELPSLAGALCSRLAASCSTFPLRALHISLDAVQITMHAKATEHIVENESLWDLAEEGALSVTLVAGPDTLHTPAAVETLVSAFALQDIGALLLDDYEGFLDEPLVCHLLRRTPNLRLVHARHDAASPVVSALLSDATARGPDDPEVLPRLEVLVLEEVDMNWAFDSTPFVHMLQEAQFLRCLRRSPIDELRVKRCMNVGPNDIRTLCHLFTDVHWDSFEAYVTDAESDQEADEVWPDENIWADYWEYEGVEWHS
ncbi:uncharacterized protein PHACADRAFT_264495 [Phanerochaete carnosa HHB-10118-sp]|uniref:Uncharacterized protein n=1 Tax=Phanerochaete carnosa (strain HHB-10118-sp) TaxID=650164 RepID=K5WIE8_PHACS|nr:uncharacterized protein PHACADRAFT_264495 [Phanerochaete carnosa HHB-10118-sp]EKM50012.1 hypothetical protein PHACADRAFT_264495 [Phanerochaete carnosa HHB-10118-sp]